MANDLLVGFVANIATKTKLGSQATQLLTMLSNDSKDRTHFVGCRTASVFAMSMVIPVDVHRRRYLANLPQDADIRFINRITITVHQPIRYQVEQATACAIWHCLCRAAGPTIHTCTNDILHRWQIVLTKPLDKLCSAGPLWCGKITKTILITKLIGYNRSFIAITRSFAITPIIIRPI